MRAFFSMGAGLLRYLPFARDEAEILVPDIEVDTTHPPAPETDEDENQLIEHISHGVVPLRADAFKLARINKKQFHLHVDVRHIEIERYAHTNEQSIDRFSDWQLRRKHMFANATLGEKILALPYLPNLFFDRNVVFGGTSFGIE